MWTKNADYFDLFTTGIGYLNTIKEITPDDGLPFLVVRIAALRGSTTKAAKTYFDCHVAGRAAHEMVRFLAPDVERGSRVLIRFRMSDLTGETFVYAKGPKMGTSGVKLKTRLIGVDWARVNGKTVKLDTIPFDEPVD